MTAKAVFVFSIICFSDFANAIYQVPEALKDGVRGNPGIQTCLRQKSLSPIRDFFGHLVDNEIAKIDPPDTTIKFPGSNQGSMTIRNMKFVSYSSASKHAFSLAPPNQTEWTSTGLNFNVSGRFGSTVQQLFSSTQTSGTISLAAKNASVTLRTRIFPTKNGKQQLEVVSCKANFENTTANTQASGFFGALAKFFQSIVSSNSASFLENIICNTARDYVDKVLNDMYARQSTSVSLFDSGDRRDPSAKTRSPIPILPSELILNYGLLRNARVYKNCLGMQEIGEVSWENKSGTPFFAPRLNYSTKLTNDHMLDIWLSDYVLNSLLYHANTRGVFDLILDQEKTPQLIENLGSQCPIGNGIIDCIGNSIPELANPNDFPKQIVEMRLNFANSSGAPFVLFREDLPSVLTADIVIDLFLNDTKGKRKNVITAEGRIQSLLSNFKLDARSILSAETIKTNAVLKISQNQLFLIPSVTGARTISLGVFVSSIIEKIINRKLAEGIPLWRIKGFNLIKPEAVLLNRTMNIASDVELDRAYWINEASQARIRLQSKKN